MKIAIRGGHCPKATGAKGIIDELTEDRKVKNSVIKYLKQLNYSDEFMERLYFLRYYYNIGGNENELQNEML